MSTASGKSLLGWFVVLMIGAGASVWQLQAPSSQYPDHHGGHQQAVENGPQPMFSWQPHEAHRIELQSANRSVDMVLTEAGWRGQPPGFDAAAFVEMFSRARADRRFEPMPDGDYGLEPGAMTLMVKDAKARVLASLVVGERLPDGIGRYVRGTAEPTITVIPEYQVRPVLQAVGAALADMRPADVRAMDMQRAAAREAGGKTGEVQATE